MRKKEVSAEEERHLLNLSVIPGALVTYLLIALFIYFERNQQTLSLWHYLIYFGIPFMILVPTTIFFSYEIFYSRKANQPVKEGFKRFLGRMLLLLVALSTFEIILAITFFGFTQWIDQWEILVLTGAVWFGTWAVLVFRFKELFNKLFAGKW